MTIQITEHTGRAVGAVVDALAKKPFEPERKPTGFPGSVYAAHLPVGWVQVTHFPKPFDDVNDSYVGPVLSETESSITIEVFDSPMTLMKRYCIVDHSPNIA